MLNILPCDKFQFRIYIFNHPCLTKFFFLLIDRLNILILKAEDAYHSLICFCNNTKINLLIHTNTF
jgi:hypothetical protein